MCNKNVSIRRRLAAYGIPQWRLARAVGVSEQSMVRWLREPLEGEHRQRVEDALARLCSEAEQEAEQA